ncbi:phosphonate ABC transporter phosphate-binding periplasmic component [Nonlabens ulvanivorans]|uniref:Phosphonate ABC transporter phosphate-binding periplasmic component n=1 Tax=Nonlabens ulvanivorans TaxID=906888 RepID=A0A090QFL6_NONUL|nr:phosphonate ABC transporter phosphate-binding periplasmic component [Nonlabens ulvanivorans]
MIKKATLLIAAIVLLVGCQTVRVSQDYAVGTDFNQFKTYGYFKQGIDEADINDLDKKRILKAIDEQMLASGWAKSQTPDVMINIFTKTQQRVDVYNNWGWNAGFGWGWVD